MKQRFTHLVVYYAGFFLLLIAGRTILNFAYGGGKPVDEVMYFAGASALWGAGVALYLLLRVALSMCYDEHA